MIYTVYANSIVSQKTAPILPTKNFKMSHNMFGGLSSYFFLFFVLAFSLIHRRRITRLPALYIFFLLMYKYISFPPAIAQLWYPRIAFGAIVLCILYWFHVSATMRSPQMPLPIWDHELCTGDFGITPVGEDGLPQARLRLTEIAFDGTDERI